MTASGAARRGNGGRARVVVLAGCVCGAAPPTIAAGHGGRLGRGGEYVEDNTDDTWRVSNAVRRGLLGTDDTIIMSAPPP